MPGPSIFISYTTQNDEGLLLPNGTLEKGWVTLFLNHLMNIVWPRLRMTADELVVERDRNTFMPDKELSDQIAGKLSGSHVFLAIASQNYLASAWCCGEVKLAADLAMKNPPPPFHIFMVEFVKLSEDDRKLFPAPIPDLPFQQFWQPLGDDPNKHRDQTLSLAVNRDEYISRLTKLAGDIVDRLRPYVVAYLAGKAGGAPVAVTAAPLLPSPAPAPPDPFPPCVVLARVTEKLIRVRDQLRDYLESTGVTVVLAERFPGDPVRFRAALADALQPVQSLFVQLLDNDPGTPVEDTTWVRLQADSALEATGGASQDRIMQWASEKTMEGLPAGHRELLDRATVRRQSPEVTGETSFRDFEFAVMTAAVNLAEKAAAPPPPPPPSKAQVLVSYVLKDFSVVRPLLDLLNHIDSIEAHPFAATNRQQLERRLKESDYVILVRGEAPPNWVRGQLDQAAQSGKLHKARGVYDPPRAGKEPLDKAMLATLNATLIGGDAGPGELESALKQFLGIPLA